MNTNPNGMLCLLGLSEATQNQHKSIAELVAAQAIARPDAEAITSSRAVLTYRDLETRADELARNLRALGVGPDVVVGLCLRRSPAMVVGALAILKAGGAYLPLDPADPWIRLAFMLDDSEARVLVTTEAVSEQTPDRIRHVIALDESGHIANSRPSARSVPPQAAANGKNLAYVIYTSGSTGTPKGVEITQESLLNLVSWHQRAFEVTAADRASQLARVGFDAAVWEIWPYLTAGASLHVPDEESLSNPEALRDWLVAQGLTISFVPTPMAERLLALRWPEQSALRVMLTGGDTLHTHPPAGLPFHLVNNYGPTECTVVATSGVVPPRNSANGLPPIGLPIANTQVYVLDESLRPVPVGTTGEIYIGGAGVARGYRNRPELTATKFVPNPFSNSSERLFKTGDLARCLPDGQIAFLGRADEQVKIRGFRIEPNEIVAALNQHPAVSQSVVVARDVNSGDRQLVAYFVPLAEARPALSEVRGFLGARLPDYMIPAAFVVLERLPLTPNGKVDRAALPVPDGDNTLRDEAFTGPRTEVEKIVAGILAPLLGLKQVDVEENFFALGGHSLLGIQLISRVRSALGVELSLRTVFEAPSVAELSAEIEALLRADVEAMSEDEVHRNLNLAPQSQA